MTQFGWLDVTNPPPSVSPCSLFIPQSNVKLKIGFQENGVSSFHIRIKNGTAVGQRNISLLMAIATRPSGWLHYTMYESYMWFVHASHALAVEPPAITIATQPLSNWHSWCSSFGETMLNRGGRTAQPAFNVTIRQTRAIDGRRKEMERKGKGMCSVIAFCAVISFASNKNTRTASFRRWPRAVCHELFTI